MKFLLLALFVPHFAHALPPVPCKGKAVRTAMAMYLKGGPYQGDQPEVDHRLLKANGEQLTHAVIIDGYNDEGETWSMRYKIVTESKALCRVVSAKNVKRF